MLRSRALLSFGATRRFAAPGLALFSTSLAATLFLTGCGPKEEPGPSPAPVPPSTKGEPGKKLTVLLVPKRLGAPYFTSCAKGAKQAAQDLGINLIYAGPTDGSSEKAAKLIESKAGTGVDVVAVSANDADILAPAMKAAAAKGSKVITWDADGEPATRQLFVNQATPEQLGNALVDALARDLGDSQPSYPIAIVTAAVTAANQNEWIKAIKDRLAKYPKLVLKEIKPSGEDKDLAVKATRELLQKYPNLKGIIGLSHLACPAAAAAVKAAGKTGKVLVTGLSTPADMKPFLMDGTAKSVATWNTEELGYLTVEVAKAVANGEWKPGQTTLKADKLGDKKVEGDQVLLGDILVLTKSNIDQYHF